MTSLQQQIEQLAERVGVLENIARRTTRGRTNKTGAAQYLGKSREWLRLRIKDGDGPPFDADGTITFDALDAYAERCVPLRSTTACSI